MQESLHAIRNKKEAFECLKKMYEIAYYAGFSKELRMHLMDAVILGEQEIDSMFLKMPVTVYINPNQYDEFAKSVLGNKPVQANQI